MYKSPLQLGYLQIDEVDAQPSCIICMHAYLKCPMHNTTIKIQYARAYFKLIAQVHVAMYNVMNSKCMP